MHGQALIRRTIGMGWTQWQHLPDAQSGCLQKIYKATGILSQVTVFTVTRQ